MYEYQSTELLNNDCMTNTVCFHNVRRLALPTDNAQTVNRPHLTMRSYHLIQRVMGVREI